MGKYNLRHQNQRAFDSGECIRRLALYVELVSSKEMVNRIEFL